MEYVYKNIGYECSFEVKKGENQPEDEVLICVKKGSSYIETYIKLEALERIVKLLREDSNNG